MHRLRSRVIFNYLAHECWTFAGERHAGYIWRFGKFVWVSLFILALRVAVICLIEPYAVAREERVHGWGGAGI
jgi:putative flippase GtrA